jgi:TonB-linked SusC/RagA family outer membrane protein
MRKLVTVLLCLFFAVFQLAAQNKTITGKVTDAEGKPVAGASVQVKGTKQGVSANDAGIYSINVPASATTLIISGVGLASQDVKIGSNNVLNVSMVASNKDLDEVVVVAYGTAKKSTNTGSQGVVGAKDIAQRPISNVNQALEGAIPGVITGTANGQPGSGVSIRVRGFGSINASSDPLFVVDGVPYVGGTSNINPDDVESTTVLKDASATALYGSRAANGVIMITTKRGKKGRNNISMRMLQGQTSRGLEEYQRVDAFQYYPMMWEAYRNSLVYPTTGVGISLDSANRVASGLTTRTGIHGLLTYNPFNVPNNAIVGTNGRLNPNAQLIYGDDLDWTKELINKGNRQEYNINFSGGSDKSDYFLSLSHLDDKGYTLRSDLKRSTLRLNVNINPLSWVKTGLNVTGNFATSNQASDGGSTSFVNPFFFTRNMGPIYPVYAHNMTTGAYLLDATGNRFWDLGNMGAQGLGLSNRPSGASSGRHALAETSLNDQNYRRSVVSARNFVDITFLKDFKFTNNISVDYQTQYDASFENTLVGDGAPAGRSSRDYSSNMGFITSQLLNYNKKLGDHRVDVLVGREAFNQYQESLGGFKQGQSLSGNTELGNFTTINSSTSSVDRYRIESYFSRANYDYKGKYFVSGSIRRDGNSRFAAESRWGTFWSVGGGWNIDKENFMKNVSFVNQLKLRSSYGVVGVADGIGLYAYQGLYGFANNANDPGIVQSQTAFLNKSLTWETNKQFDIGLDFALFKNRLTGSVEYYHRVSADLLFAVPQPLSSGALTVNQNTATMFNKGIELQLNGDVLKTKDFVWNMNLNLSTVVNQITKMPESVPDFVTGTKKYQVGVSIFDYWLRTYYGVDPTDGAPLFVAQSTAANASRRLITNKNGGLDTLTTDISNGKFEYQGSTIPDFYGSFTQSVTYKQFTLSALFMFQVGGLTYDQNYASLMAVGTSYGAAYHTDILNRWQKPGDITNVPRLDAGRSAQFNGASSRWLIDASYFNIRTVNLSYNLPKSLTNRMKVNNGQFFVSIENALFSSKRIGLNNQQAFSGVTSNAYPPARVFTVGVSLNL